MKSERVVTEAGADVKYAFDSQYWDRDEKIKFMDTHGIDVSVSFDGEAFCSGLFELMNAPVAGRLSRQPLARLSVR